MLNVLPTVVEFVLVVGMLMFEFDWRYVAIVLARSPSTCGSRSRRASWRIEIRRDMNDSDTEANTKAIDSLLNLRDGEVLRQRGARGEPLRHVMARYEEAAIKTYPSLAMLNIGQAVIFTIGMTACMVLAAAASPPAPRRSASS